MGYWRGPSAVTSSALYPASYDHIPVAPLLGSDSTALTNCKELDQEKERMCFSPQFIDSVYGWLMKRQFKVEKPTLSS
jgi:hypothetical protein